MGSEYGVNSEVWSLGLALLEVIYAHYNIIVDAKKRIFF